MSKKFQLQIPEPCHEDWNKMTPVDKGRFCDSCQKSVVDFTGMSDKQLVAFFKKPSTGSVCGRFHNDQLERDIAFPKKRIPWFKYMLQICLPVFIANTKAISQGKPQLKINELTITCPKPDSNKIEMVVGQMALPPMKSRLQGRVMDEDDNAIPFATVIIRGTKQGVNCDADGYFNLKVKPKDKFVTIIASSIGYEQKEKTISNNDGSMNKIVLAKEATVLDEVVVTANMGKIVCRQLSQGFVTTPIDQTLLAGTLGGISVTYIKEDSILTTIRGFFIKDSLKVYPNPARSGSVIKIEIKNVETGEMQIELLNLQGQLISSSVTNIFEKNPIITYQLPNIIAGSYFIRIAKRESGKTQTEKIIIQ